MPNDTDRLQQAKLHVRAIATWVPSPVAVVRELRERTFMPEGAKPPDWRVTTRDALEAHLAPDRVEQYRELLEGDSPEERAHAFLIELAENLTPTDLR